MADLALPVPVAIDGAVDLIGDIAGPYVLLSLAGRSIGGIVPNVTLQEVLADENTITAHPVQSGTPVSDHVYANPSIIDMQVGWSDSTGGYPGYVQDVYQAMLALRDTRQLFDVSTGKRQYSNMLFGAITATTDETSENILMLRARMQEVIISDTSGGDASLGSNADQASPQTTGAETNVGNQSLQPASASGLTPIGTVAGPV